ncbi:MAG TPA: MBL fold metallo-hydrolase RNA specificity domain-containing protein, partial [Candidatus Paceibacterota bacterium]
GAKKIKINGIEVPVRAKVESIMGYSSHKDSDNLLEFVATAQDTLKKTFVVMGELRASTFLAQRINNELGIKAVCPEAGVGYELE